MTKPEITIINGLFVIHFLAIENPDNHQTDKTIYADSISTAYREARNFARPFGGRKYHNKSFGGGIAFKNQESLNDCLAAVQRRSIVGTENSNLNPNHRKEHNRGSSILAILKKDNEYDSATVTIDIHLPNKGASRVYACVWINDSKSGTHVSGSDYTSGGGYDKTTAAIRHAFNSAGMVFGAGYHDDCEMVKSVMTTLGYKRSEYVIAKR